MKNTIKDYGFFAITTEGDDVNLKGIGKNIQDYIVSNNEYHHPIWMPAKKKIYRVRIDKCEPGIVVYNKLENVKYTTTEDRQFVVTGTAGEQWVIDEQKKQKTYYEKKQGTNGYYWTKPDENLYFVRKANGKEEIKTAWGDILHANRDGIDHGNGDWIVSMDIMGNDQWVVNGIIFEKTYHIIE